MSNIPPKLTIEDNGLFSEFYGAFTENFIAQKLAIKHHPLYYWSSKGTAEIDFLIECEKKILPLEVKAGISRRKKSLIVYQTKYKPELLLRASPMNLKVK